MRLLSRVFINVRPSIDSRDVVECVPAGPRSRFIAIVAVGASLSADRPSTSGSGMHARGNPVCVHVQPPSPCRALAYRSKRVPPTLHPKLLSQARSAVRTAQRPRALGVWPELAGDFDEGPLDGLTRLLIDDAERHLNVLLRMKRVELEQKREAPRMQNQTTRHRQAHEIGAATRPGHTSAPIARRLRQRGSPDQTR